MKALVLRNLNSGRNKAYENIHMFSLSCLTVGQDHAPKFWEQDNNSILHSGRYRRNV